MPGSTTIDDGSTLTLTGLTAGALNAELVPSTDVSQFRWINVAIGPDAYSGLLVPKWSNDNNTWEDLKMYPMTTLDAGDITAAGTSATNVTLGTFVSFKYFKMTMDSYTSGAATGTFQAFTDGLPSFQLTHVYSRVIYGQVVRTSSSVILASGAVSGNGDSGTLQNLNARGVRVYVTPGSFGAGASNIIVTIQEIDLATGDAYDLLSTTALVASTPQVLKIYPSLTAVANVSVNDFLPNAWRIKWAASNWGSGGSTLGISCALSE